MEADKNSKNVEQLKPIQKVILRRNTEKNQQINNRAIKDAYIVTKKTNK